MFTLSRHLQLSRPLPWPRSHYCPSQTVVKNYTWIWFFICIQVSIWGTPCRGWSDETCFQAHLCLNLKRFMRNLVLDTMVLLSCPLWMVFSLRENGVLWMRKVKNLSASRPGILFPRLRSLRLHHSIRISSDGAQMALLQKTPDLETYKSHPVT